MHPSTPKTGALDWVPWPSLIALIIIALFLVLALIYAPLARGRSEPVSAVATTVGPSLVTPVAVTSPLERQLQEREFCQCHE